MKPVLASDLSGDVPLCALIRIAWIFCMLGVLSSAGRGCCQMLIKLYKNIFKLDSIRGRYLIGAALLLVLFLVSVWGTHLFISSAVQETADRASNRQQLRELQYLLRDHLWRAEYAIQTYLVTPEEKEFRQVISNLDDAISCVDKISNDKWIYENGLYELLQQLTENLFDLKNRTHQLMSIRSKAEELFPAYSAINELMLPQNTQFISMLDLAVDELSSWLSESKIQESYRLLNNVRNDWTDMIGAFRLFIASKAMSLADSVGKNNEYQALVESHNLLIERNLEKLQARIARYDHGLQTEITIKELIDTRKKWYEAYLVVSEIYATNNWRMDELLVSESIQPLQIQIWQKLNAIEQALVTSSQTDVNRLAKVASDASSKLWLRMVVALLFIVVTFFAFEYWILRPVARIARALKAEADGHDIQFLPRANTKETRELIEAFEEMRSQVRIRQMELEHQAMHDSLTGLPNRLLLRKSLMLTIEHAKSTQGQFALLMIDLDRFKHINDTLGHHTGDMVLKEIGPRFMTVLSKQDLLARLGGDEFAVLLSGADAARASDVARRLAQSLDMDFNIDGQKLNVGSSIGIALYPQHGSCDQALMQRADVAMYLAKHEQLGYATYDDKDAEHSVWQLSFNNELIAAIENDYLEIYYQPKINLTTNKVVGVEALLRWHHPKQGLIPAEEIHLLAEKTGLIKPLTKWIVHKVIEQLSIWESHNINLRASINLSIWNLQDDRLVECIRLGLRQWNVPAKRLIFEISESAVMSNPDHSMQALNQLADIGVCLSIDDFGTGFSSLQYLRKLPIYEIKIDKSFVMDMIVDDNDAVIVKSIINLAESLGLNVVAEGVESQDIYDLLQILRCNEAQGYHMSKPLSVTDLEHWLSTSLWSSTKEHRLTVIK